MRPRQPSMAETRKKKMIEILILTVVIFVADSADTNDVFSPCLDAKIQKSDGFTFGIAFSTKDSFFFNQTQLSPCDIRLSLSNQDAQLAVFRPKVDQISFLTIHRDINPVLLDGYMVAFAGQKYAARSPPALVVHDSLVITNFILLLEFERGTLQNLYWKKFPCKACTEGSSSSDSVCINNEDCAVPTSKCSGNGGSVDCNITIQLAFSGTDKNLQVLNSWFEVNNLGRNSLHGLFPTHQMEMTLLKI